MKKIAVCLFTAIIFLGSHCSEGSKQTQTKKISPEKERIVELFRRQIVERYAQEHPETYLKAHDTLNTLAQSNTTLYNSLMQKYGSDEVFDDKTTRHIGIPVPLFFTVETNNEIKPVTLPDVFWETVLPSALSEILKKPPFDVEQLFLEACLKRFIKTEIYRTMGIEIINILANMGPLADLYIASKAELLCIQDNPPLYFGFCGLPLWLGGPEVEKALIARCSKR
jgi:hypothetical protein